VSQGHERHRHRSLEDSARERPRRGLAAPWATDDTRPPASGREGGGHRASAGSGLRPAVIGLRPARLVRRSPEREAAARAALRILYRDFLAGGGLDIARASRCPGASRKSKRRAKDR
jgi:hypothetical protein